jgi:hypothetical protein
MMLFLFLSGKGSDAKGDPLDGNDLDFGARAEILIGNNRPGTVAHAHMAAPVYQGAIQRKLHPHQLLSTLVEPGVGGLLPAHLS